VVVREVGEATGRFPDGVESSCLALQVSGIDMLTARQQEDFQMGLNPLASPLQVSGIDMLTASNWEVSGWYGILLPRPYS